MIRGIDVSSHQPIIDWGKVKAAGYEFAAIKITGGKSYVNPLWRAQYDGARAAGLAVGLYHYDGEPSIETGTPEEEGAHMVAHLPDPLPPDVFLAYDIEERATRDADRYRRFLAFVRKATGKVCYLYTFKSFVEEVGAAFWQALKDFPLWFAWYPFVIDPLPAPPPPPAPWTSYKAWQYSGGTAIPGIPNATDANAFYGTLAELTGVATPPPFQHAPGWLDPLVDSFDWTQDGTPGAGIITHRLVRAYNDEERKTYQREWDASTGFTPWAVVGDAGAQQRPVGSPQVVE